MSTPASIVPDTTAEPATNSPLRFVTAASLFDGHDAAINIMRRLIQSQGAEVVHLGHNRSVEDVVRAALQEDADGIALSSYQGGHVEYFKYMVDMLRERGAGHIKVFGGGGGTITPEEIRELQAYGVERIYHPNDGMHMGLVAMIEDVVRHASLELPRMFAHIAHPLERLEALVRGTIYLSEILQPWFYFVYMDSRVLSHEQRAMAKGSEMSVQTLISQLLEQFKPQPEGDPMLMAGHIVSLFQDWYVKRWKYRAAKVHVDDFADSVLLLIRSHLQHSRE